MSADKPARREPELRLIHVAIVLLVLFGIFVVVLWQVGLFDVGATTGDAQRFAAVLGLVGGFFATLLTFAAALLKHSVDVRTLGQARETEDRLRLETSIQAVSLLTEEGKKAQPTRQAGALFVLGSLGQVDFALALLSELWPKGDISSAAAVWVVNRALLEGNEQTQIDAALQLSSNAVSLTETSTASCWEWPACISFAWPQTIYASAREELFYALIKVMRAKDAWSDECRNSMVFELDVIRKTEQEPHIRSAAILCLDMLLATEFASDNSQLLLPGGPLMVDTLRAEIAPLVDDARIGAPTLAVTEIDELRNTWVGDADEDEASPRPGRLPPEAPMGAERSALEG